jgi:hypothetical protein
MAMAGSQLSAVRPAPVPSTLWRWLIGAIIVVLGLAAFSAARVGPPPLGNPARAAAIRQQGTPIACEGNRYTITLAIPTEVLPADEARRERTMAAAFAMVDQHLAFLLDEGMVLDLVSGIEQGQTTIILDLRIPAGSMATVLPILAQPAELHIIPGDGLGLEKGTRVPVSATYTPILGNAQLEDVAVMTNDEGDTILRLTLSQAGTEALATHIAAARENRSILIVINKLTVDNQTIADPAPAAIDVGGLISELGEEDAASVATDLRVASPLDASFMRSDPEGPCL